MSQQERDLITSCSVGSQPGLLRDFLTPATEASAAAWEWEVLEASVRVQGAVSAVADVVERSIRRIGTPQPDGDVLVALVGTGWRNLNRAVVTVTLRSDCGDGEVRLAVRSVAAEGLVKQHGAVKAFDRFVEDLRQYAEITIDSVSSSTQERTGKASTRARLFVAISFLGLGLLIAEIVVRGTAGRALNLAGWILFFVLVFLVLRSRRRRKKNT